MQKRTPTAFRLKARGCEERATLGETSERLFNRNAVASNQEHPHDNGLYRLLRDENGAKRKNDEHDIRD